MRWMTVASLAFLGGITGCAVTPLHRPTPTGPPTARTASTARLNAGDDADMIAQEAVRARVTLILHVDRLAHHRFARSLLQLGGIAEALAGTGVDPLRDVQRAFLAAPTSHLGEVAIVLQHSAEEAAVARALAALGRSFRAAHRRGKAVFKPGEGGVEGRIARNAAWLPDPARYPFPAAYRIVDKAFSGDARPVLIAAPHPGLLAVLPPEQVMAAFRMMEGGGLPGPAAGEAMVLRAWDPRSSLLDGPVWSRDVRYAEVAFAVGAAGGATVRLRAQCSSAAAARAQARRMSAELDRALRLPFGGLRLFDAIELRAEEDRVTAHTHLFAEDVDWLVAMTMRRR